MYVLGLSSYYHDSAAVLLKDCEVVCAIEEERFTRKKHDNAFPLNAAKFCLDHAGITIDRVSAVSYYEKPLLKFERILETFIDTYPRSFIPFSKSLPEWLDVKIKIGKTIKDKLGYKGKVYYLPHHLSHAAAAFLPSGFNRSAILTIDGVGDYPSTGLWFGENRGIAAIKTLNFPDSLGLFYSTLTSFLGFKVNNDEYKVMGLSAYGSPRYKRKLENLLDIKSDGSFKMDMDYFSFRENFRMWSGKFEKVFGKPRIYGGKITKRDADLAASLQSVTEDIYFLMLNYLYKETAVTNLCIGGGVALNSLANGKIYQKTPFKNIYILGAAGDSGAALGSALYTFHNIIGKGKRRKIKTLYFGGGVSDNEVEKELVKYGLKYTKITDQDNLVNITAGKLKQNRIVGWYQGRCEFGPRALGARSILANPKKRDMKDKVNKIKKREKFRPFAGSVLQNHIADLFEVPEKRHYSPFMNFCFPVLNGKRKHISAIVHRDGTCRVQTVNEDNGLYFKLIEKFYTLTEIPCILNTSFNIGGEPIVNTPKEAIDDFLNSPIDDLVIGKFLVSKD